MGRRMLSGTALCNDDPEIHNGYAAEVERLRQRRPRVARMKVKNDKRVLNGRRHRVIPGCAQRREEAGPLRSNR